MSHREIALAYEVLGLRPGATEIEARAARRALVRSFHPDVYRGDRAAADRKLAQINAAFDDVKADLCRNGAGDGAKVAPAAAGRATPRERRRSGPAAHVHAGPQRRVDRNVTRDTAARRRGIEERRARIEAAAAAMPTEDRSVYEAARTAFASTRSLQDPLRTAKLEIAL